MCVCVNVLRLCANGATNHKRLVHKHIIYIYIYIYIYTYTHTPSIHMYTHTYIHTGVAKDPFQHVWWVVTRQTPVSGTYNISYRDRDRDLNSDRDRDHQVTNGNIHIYNSGVCVEERTGRACMHASSLVRDHAT
jgi:hypothetical protein